MLGCGACLGFVDWSRAKGHGGGVLSQEYLFHIPPGGEGDY